MNALPSPSPGGIASAGQPQTGGVASAMQGTSMPMKQPQQAQPNPQGKLPKDLLELLEAARLMKLQEASARQQALQNAPQGEPKSITEQLLEAVRAGQQPRPQMPPGMQMAQAPQEQGIPGAPSGMPQQFAGGGIIGFQSGGSATPVPAEFEKFLRARNMTSRTYRLEHPIVQDIIKKAFTAENAKMGPPRPPAPAAAAPAAAAPPRAGGILDANVGDAAKKTARGAGKAAMGVGRSLASGAGRVVLPLGAAMTAAQIYGTPTEEYAKRMGATAGEGFWSDVGIRGMGALGDIGDFATFGQATRLGNLLAGNGYSSREEIEQEQGQAQAQAQAKVTPIDVSEKVPAATLPPQRKPPPPGSTPGIKPAPAAPSAVQAQGPVASGGIADAQVSPLQASTEAGLLMRMGADTKQKGVDARNEYDAYMGLQAAMDQKEKRLGAREEMLAAHAKTRGAQRGARNPWVEALRGSMGKQGLGGIGAGASAGMSNAQKDWDAQDASWNKEDLVNADFSDVERDKMLATILKGKESAYGAGTAAETREATSRDNALQVGATSVTASKNAAALIKAAELEANAKVKAAGKLAAAQVGNEKRVFVQGMSALLREKQAEAKLLAEQMKDPMAFAQLPAMREQLAAIHRQSAIYEKAVGDAVGLKTPEAGAADAAAPKTVKKYNPTTGKLE